MSDCIATLRQSNDDDNDDGSSSDKGLYSSTHSSFGGFMKYACEF